jgi:hypothetical protein
MSRSGLHASPVCDRILLARNLRRHVVTQHDVG